MLVRKKLFLKMFAVISGDETDDPLKIKKTIFSIGIANISQLFLLDKLVSGQGL
jgi:hypothetical protein